MKRNPWSLLTARGKMFLIAGLAVAILAILFGQNDVLWLALLLVLLPAISLLFIARTRLRLSLERGFDHGEMPIGDTLEATLRLEKQGNLPAGLLLFEENVPPALGRRPRFGVNNVSGSWQRDVSYPLVGNQRGRYTVGPLLVRSRDAFNLVKFDRQFTATSEVLVTPRIHPLAPMDNVTGGGSSGEVHPQRLGVIGSDDVLIREYRQGDDVRRVHWRSTARRGELMVRREEQAWDPSVTLILDSRARAHGGPGRESSFEYAVSCAASIAMHFVEHGFAVHLYDAQGDMLPRDTDRTFNTTSQHVLHCFTDVQPAPLRDLSEGLQSSLLGQQGQLIVAVTGRLTPSDAEALLRTRRNRAHGLAVVLDVDSFVSRNERADEEARAAHEQAVQMLRNQMWRVAEVKRTTPITDAWKDLEQLGEYV
ncbi:DUF58 domain-containing protein [Enemella evansiae]|uniref:DUF58 domain-containing protein n=1 Tax=Enemella evansiae TaxID=2016499 RepID=UPI000C01ED97|nr:DUF58 domain-containing protein [Enemella evansiae]PFG67920.1 uncharacterized protein (DUF58 family) [Propionibacteriaceae bacterium ES.041]TDO93769.1 uncharacterized protein (DUF58 family) [Enemella evansiae]